jgi:hypothetical protein
MGVALGDLDGDGQIDMFITSTGARAPLKRFRESFGTAEGEIEEGNRLYFNKGKGTRAFGCKGASCRGFEGADGGGDRERRAACGSVEDPADCAAR